MLNVFSLFKTVVKEVNILLESTSNQISDNKMEISEKPPEHLVWKFMT